ncbi:MAG: hypothetical protein EOP57_00175 [Sphingomonadales bacterium]|nr:MAG: hypothetical protein EOP57_00175 [Sphingomonadales bacterium]
MRAIVSSLALATAALLLVACQTADNRVTSLPTDTRPKGVDGSWASVGGSVAYDANFRAGRFTSTEAGTGAVLAEGTYKLLGPGQVTIDYTSKLRGTRVAANCNQVEVNRLACASSNGNRFEFTRRS